MDTKMHVLEAKLLTRAVNVLLVGAGGTGSRMLEKLVAPYPSITGHVFCARVPLALGSDLAAWDAWLAERLLPEELATKPFTPLPVLGVPGWWAANEAPNFYDDVGIFRPPRVTV